MTENIESLMLEHLRAIRTDIGDLRTRMTGIESRLGSLEMTVAGMRRSWLFFLVMTGLFHKGL